MNDVPDKWAKQLPQQEYIERLESQIKQQKSRIDELEQRVEHLRVSRRVLMNLLEKVEREKVAVEFSLKRRRNKKFRPNNPFEVVVDNSKTFYIRVDNIPQGKEFDKERNLTYDPKALFKEFYTEESNK